MAATAVTLCGIELENPIIPASGTFGYGQEFAQLYDINMLGTFSFKGTTRAPRFGNPTPRIAEYAGGMLNAVGLQNPGVDAVIAHELPELKKVFHKPVMANVSGFSVEEYAEVCARLDAQPQVGWLEVNISCPNVHGGGAAFGAEPSAAAEVTRAVRAVTKKPIILKLSPTAADIAAEPHQHPGDLRRCGAWASRACATSSAAWSSPENEYENNLQLTNPHIWNATSSLPATSSPQKIPSASSTSSGTRRKPFLKIGMELFYAEGPAIVREIKRRGHKIFLDLKLHDIPNTVRKAMAVLSRLDVDMCNVHAAGTIEMMRAARGPHTRGRHAAAADRRNAAHLDERGAHAVRTAHRRLDQRDDRTVCPQHARGGVDGVVCSPLEAGMVHEACGADFLTVTPGVRFADGDVGDQVRVMTPARAREIGSDFIVVGRPITAAADPVAAYRRCVAEFVG